MPKYEEELGRVVGSRIYSGEKTESEDIISELRGKGVERILDGDIYISTSGNKPILSFNAENEKFEPIVDLGNEEVDEFIDSMMKTIEFTGQFNPNSNYKFIEINYTSTDDVNNNAAHDFTLKLFEQRDKTITDFNFSNWYDSEDDRYYLYLTGNFNCESILSDGELKVNGDLEVNGEGYFTNNGIHINEFWLHCNEDPIINIQRDGGVYVVLENSNQDGASLSLSRSVNEIDTFHISFDDDYVQLGTGDTYRGENILWYDFSEELLQFYPNIKLNGSELYKEDMDSYYSQHEDFHYEYIEFDYIEQTPTGYIKEIHLYNSDFDSDRDSDYSFNYILRIFSEYDDNSTDIINIANVPGAVNNYNLKIFEGAFGIYFNPDNSTRQGNCEIHLPLDSRKDDFIDMNNILTGSVILFGSGVRGNTDSSTVHINPYIHPTNAQGNYGVISFAQESSIYNIGYGLIIGTDEKANAWVPIREENTDGQFRRIAHHPMFQRSPSLGIVNNQLGQYSNSRAYTEAMVDFWDYFEGYYDDDTSSYVLTMKKGNTQRCVDTLQRLISVTTMSGILFRDKDNSNRAYVLRLTGVSFGEEMKSTTIGTNIRQIDFYCHNKVCVRYECHVTEFGGNEVNIVLQIQSSFTDPAWVTNVQLSIDYGY